MLKRLLYSFSARLAANLFNFIILFMGSRYLGSEVWGQVNLVVLNISVIQTLNEIYTGASLVHFIPRANISRIYLEGLVFSLFTTGVSVAMYTLSGMAAPVNPMALALLTILVTLVSFQGLILLGKEKIKTYSFLVLLQPMMLTLILVIQIFIVEQKNFNTWLNSFVASYVIVFVVSGFFILKAKFSSGEPGVKPADVFKNGFLNQLGNLSHTLSNRLNYYLLAAPALVGVYSASVSLIEGFWIISAGVSPIVLGYAANNYSDKMLAAKTLAIAKACLLLVSVAILVLWFLPAGFFTWLLGSDFSLTKGVMLRLSPGVALITFSSILSHYFSGLGRQKTLFLANLSGLVFTVILAWPLIKLYGLYGACYAASLAYAVQALFITFAFLKQNKISAGELFFGPLDFKLLKK